MSTIKMVCPRDYTLRSNTGYTIQFVAGEPTPVPDSLVPLAMSLNILPAEDHDDEQPVFGLLKSTVTGSLRDALVLHSIDALVKRNSPEDFNAGGAPKAAALASETGVSISAQEVSKYWDRYREIIGTNAEIPNHPSVELVRDLQQISTRKQLVEFCKEYGIAYEKHESKPLKDLKQIVLSLIINQKTLPVSDKPNSLTSD